MKIAILDTLESQQQWQAFSRRKVPYAYVLEPLSLIDFQSTFIQLTDIDKNLRDGRQALKFSIGSRQSAQPAWALIESCNWSLSLLISRLKTLDFSSNVRDNSALNVHGDLTIRQFFAKEKCVISPWLLQHLTPLNQTPRTWYLNDIKRLLSCEQYTNLQWLSQDSGYDSIKGIINQLISYPQGWQVVAEEAEVSLHFKKNPIVRFTPQITPAPAQKKSLKML